MFCVCNYARCTCKRSGLRVQRGTTYNTILHLLKDRVRDTQFEVTEELVRKRAEHNEGQIGSLEELSLHQLDIERIENIDKWCPRLKILYLQGNLISKIENLKKLKNLIYLNLAMNNLTRLENLSGCESLTKLDLTLNFIRKLSDVVDQLKDNYNLRELYLTGNPCATYEGYRQFVIAKLPHLAILDGRPIERSERIVALQNYDRVQRKISEQEDEKERELDIEKEVKEVIGIGSAETNPSNGKDTFWTEKTKHDPETRLKLHRRLQQIKGDSKECVESCKKLDKERKLTGKDGRILNINEPKADFHFVDDEDEDKIVLDVSVFKYLETSLIQVDVQPNYVQVFIKHKLLQLVLPEEVKPDQSVVQRSQATGHLVIIMPKAKGTLKPNIKSNGNQNELNSKTKRMSTASSIVAKNSYELDLNFKTRNCQSLMGSSLKSLDISDVPELI